MKLVNDVDRIIWFYIFNARDILQAQEHIPVSECVQTCIDMCGEDSLMGLVHVREHHVAHAEDGAYREYTGSNTEHGQQGACLIVPDIEPDFVPDDAHLKPALSKIPCVLRGTKVPHDPRGARVRRGSAIRC